MIFTHVCGTLVRRTGVRMSYVDDVPKYVYELPCGHRCESSTRSDPDDLDGLHWFCCRRHVEPVWAGISPDDLSEYRPLKPSGRMRFGDGELAKQYDAGIACDRVREYYRAYWNTGTLDEVSEALGVARNLVKRVALQLGVYEPHHRARVN